MEVPIRGNFVLRAGVGGDVAQHKVTGEIMALNKSPRGWSTGSDEDGDVFLNANDGSESVWLEFSANLMSDGPDDFWLADDDGKKLMDIKEKAQMMVLKTIQLESNPPVSVSTDEFQVPIDGASRFWKLNSLQDIVNNVGCVQAEFHVLKCA